MTLLMPLMPHADAAAADIRVMPRRAATRKILTPAHVLLRCHFAMMLFHYFRR